MNKLYYVVLQHPEFREKLRFAITVGGDQWRLDAEEYALCELNKLHKVEFSVYSSEFICNTIDNVFKTLD